MRRIALWVVTALVALSGWCRSSEPDFNYPKQVTAQAEADLKKALASGDGQMVLDAIVRASIAESQLSREKMSNIIDRIERTASSEKNVDTHALLRHFEAVVMRSYSEAFIPIDRLGDDDIRIVDPDPEATKRDPYAKWTRQQFQNRIQELVRLSLADSAALCACPVTNYPRIIACDKLGATYVPTLYQFLIKENLPLVDGDEERRLQRQWEASTAGNIVANVWTRKTIIEAGGRWGNRDEFLKIMAEHPDAEINGLLMDNMKEDRDYAMLCDYAKHYPKSIYTPEVRNNIAYIERSSVSVTHDGQWNSREPLPAHVKVRNVNSFDVDVYRLTDDMCSPQWKGDRYKVAEMTRVASQLVAAPGKVPYDTVFDIKLAALPYGKYVVVPRYKNAKGETTTLVEVGKSNVLSVYDLATFAVADNGHDDRIIVVDVVTGAPVAGATVTSKEWSATTGRDGIVKLPDNKGYASMTYTVSKGDDRFAPSTDFRRVDNRESATNGSRLFTDLAIYRPGETMHFAGVVYMTSVVARRVMPDVEVLVTFSDANGKEIGRQTLTTDRYGRVEGTFDIPTGRLLGTYSLRMTPQLEHMPTSAIAYHDVEVSEYKTPTFHVDLASNDLTYQPGEPIVVTGTARTYTDLPVADAEVKLSLRQREWDWLWWRGPVHYMRPRRVHDTQVADTTVRTDADGRFTVAFAPDRFYENQHRSYCHYLYDTHVQVTNAGGESQQADGSFRIGSKRELKIDGTFTDANATRPVRVPATVNCSDSTIMPTHLEWALCRNYSDTVAAGTTPVAEPVLDLASVPSGEYTLRMQIPGADTYSERASTTLRLYRPTDGEAPVKEAPLWVASDGYHIDERNVAHVTIGASVDVGHVYYVAYGREKVLGQGWLDVKRGITEFTFKVPDVAHENLSVNFTSMYRAKFYSQSVEMTSPVNARPLRVKATAFRDRLTPGKPERWQLQLLGGGDKPQQGALMLEMIDHAIHDLKNNNWSFAPGFLNCTPMLSWRMRFDSSRQNGTSWHDTYQDSKSDYDLPELIDYSTPLWSGCAFVVHHLDRLGAAMGGARYKSAASPAPNMGEAEGAPEEAQPAVDMARLDQVQLRMADVKTALWEPLLETDAQGNVTLEFNAPDFNTTWLVQALAFTGELSTARWAQNVLTTKPIMVKPSLPRFVRQGDQVTLAATLQNATSDTQQCDAIVELFDPRTLEVYASQTFKPTLAGQATQALTIGWTVPDTIPYVGFRVRAANADFSDGEQTMLPVLTAVSPIVESLPVFVNADQSSFDARLPHTPQPARYTLEYCDNPVWYTVTALPSVASTNSHVATSIAHSLYAVDVTQGVAKAQPIIREAVNYWQENCQDSMLVSALSRNSDLKIGNLIASPWLNASERQTLQMQQLAAWLDPATARAEHDRLVKALADLQLPDGGFTWYRYNGCESSRWTTGEVLELIGEIRNLGYLPDDTKLNQMVERALNYYDNAYVAASKKKENKKAVFANYAYVRGLFPEVEQSKASRKLVNKTLKAMGKEWKKMSLSLSEKAFYALTLERAGMHKQALPIVQSIREFALTDATRGMYWDSYLSGYWYSPSQVGATSIVLQALHAVDPKAEELDQVRKWMLLSKQTTDWGGGSLAADASYALLSTGSQWLDRAQAPVITIDGQPVEMDRFDAYMGYCRKSVEAHGGSELHIEHSGSNPAWGAVYWQYSQPMSEVQPASTHDISIHKDFYVLTPSGKPQEGALRVGDKVQVRLTITCDRDMDYLTLVDERASCFEPVDRTSGYRYGDGVGQYRETRDAGTNIFFSRLSKGTHVITYDVFVTAPGRFSSGVATIQSQQAPEVTAHSEGNILYIDN